MQRSLRKIAGVSPILVTFTLCSDSDFELRISTSKKIKRIALILILTLLTTAFERTKEKCYGSRRTERN